MTSPNRLVCWFSCGAASAVAAKLAITANNGRLPIEVVYTEVIEEHPDNQRFMKDCEHWLEHPIQVLRNERYGGSIYEVFNRDRYLVGVHGARCSKVLKKQLRQQFEHPNDMHVFGYTVEEQARMDRFLDANNIHMSAPLIERGMKKTDCLALLQRAGIELPAMYKLGYNNNNCIGCVKGGAGYWNKIRVDFPDVFTRMSNTERALGRTILKIGDKRMPLSELPLDAGHYPTEPVIDCGIFCELAEQDIVNKQVEMIV